MPRLDPFGGWTGWSDEFRLLVRPERGYRTLAAEATKSGSWTRRPVFFLLTLASTISILTTGRLTLPLVFESFVAWSFVPLLHVAAAAAVVRLLAGRRRPMAEAIDLYFTSLGPWLVWMVGLCGAALLFPSSNDLWMISKGWFLASCAAAFAWSAWINLGFFRGGLGLTLPRAALAVVAVRALVWGFVIAYLHLSDQLLPRLPWVQGHG